MFPVCDVIPSRKRPLVTIGLAAFSALAFLYQLQFDGDELQRVASDWGVMPAAFRWSTLLSSLFLHTGWLHAGANVLALWLFGANVEDRIGPIRLLALYAIAGVAAATAHLALWSGSTLPMIGASGAVAGVIGAYLVFYPHSRILTAVFAVVFFDLVEIPAMFFAIVWLALQAFTDGGAFGMQAATGTPLVLTVACGFVVGALAGLYWRLGEQTLTGYWRGDTAAGRAAR
jgi:membrane associated rhomboid family serine protease